MNRATNKFHCDLRHPIKTKMKFVKVIRDDEDGCCSQALFHNPDTGQHFLYSYVNNDFAHETMVFKCDVNGDITDWHQLAFEHGYVKTFDIVPRVLEEMSQ